MVSRQNQTEQGLGIKHSNSLSGCDTGINEGLRMANMNVVGLVQDVVTQSAGTDRKELVTLLERLLSEVTTKINEMESEES